MSEYVQHVRPETIQSSEHGLQYLHDCLLHKHHYWDPTITTSQQILDLATRNGADALRLQTGRIQEEFLADIITLDLSDLNLQPHSKETILSHIVYAANGMNVSDVLVDGKILLENKVFQ